VNIDIQIFGTGFIEGSFYKCAFHNTLAPARIISNELIICPSPTLQIPNNMTLYILQDSNPIYNTTFRFFQPPIISKLEKMASDVLVATLDSSELKDKNCVCSLDSMNVKGVFLLYNIVACDTTRINLENYKSISIICDSFVTETVHITNYISSPAASISVLTENVPQRIDIPSFNSSYSAFNDKENSPPRTFTGFLEKQSSSNLILQSKREVQISWALDQDCMIDNSITCLSYFMHSANLISNEPDALLFVSNYLNLRNSYFVIDSVEPRILNPLNGTWISINGRGFTNTSRCEVNNQTIHSSVVFTSSFMQCYIEPQHSIMAWTLYLSISTSVSRSINKIKLYYRWVDIDRNAIKSAQTAKIVNGKSSSVMEVSDICASSKGCVSNPLISPDCSLSYSQWLSFSKNNGKEIYSICNRESDLVGQTLPLQKIPENAGWLHVVMRSKGNPDNYTRMWLTIFNSR
jgi:hypothetical protein